VNNMQAPVSELQFLGITKDDIQQIFEEAIKNSQFKPSVMFIDASYMYTFHLDDFEIVKKFNILGRYDIDAVKHWHICLERWYNDQTVTLGDRTFKPIAISRSFDRVVNEGLEMLATALIGGGGTVFNFRGIGDGVITEASPADTDLYNAIDVINVDTAPEGGSFSRDGTTLYSVGNHAKTVLTPVDNEFTECAMFNDDEEATRKILDHSAFPVPIPHTQNVDAPGSTTVIYLCSS
jgi:hypothetical protein